MSLCDHTQHMRWARNIILYFSYKIRQFYFIVIVIMLFYMVRFVSYINLGEFVKLSASK